MPPFIQALDHAAINWISTSAYSREYSQFASYLVDNRELKFLPLVLVICWYWFKKTSKQQHNRQILVETVLCSLGAIFIGRVLALALPFRERPFLNHELNVSILDNPVLRTWSSFPSDHAVLSFALVASLFRISPSVGILAFLHASILICLPRVILSLHYPSDIIGGAIIGITIIAMFSQIKARERLVTAALSIEHKYAEFFYIAGFIILYEIIEMFDSIRGLVSKVFTLLNYISY